ncbi:MAG: (S)-benzoin forming benzil reductase [Bacteroidales bacterium]|nr:(S)-benzoin forming benzil reductase [Bacteroidales bacterium]MCF8332844.1 (S)-benzoin forming benzil reductase [Bacteroidales bacterium]
MKNVFIITGASRGIGAAIADELIDPANHLICSSRTKNKSLVEKAEQKGCTIDYYELDFADSSLVTTQFSGIFRTIDWENAKSVSLINNAGMLEPVARAEDSDPWAMVDHITVNLTSLMLISSGFIHAGKSHKVPKTILNISSGAAYNPYRGWSSYCTSKAGALMFSRVLAEEQKEAENPVKVISLAPGVVETSMQETIRSKSAEEFPNIDKFISLKKENKLYDPAFVARKIREEIIYNDRIRQGDEIDIRTL